MFRTLFVCAFACSVALSSAAKKQCTTKCAIDEAGEGVLKFMAEDVTVKNLAIDAEGDATDVSVALAKALTDMKNGKNVVKTKLNKLIDDVTEQYRKELKEVNDENKAKYSTFMDNHEAVVSADQTEQARLAKLKTKLQVCQSESKILRTKETAETLSGWDHTDEDGITQDNGQDLADIAQEYNDKTETDAGEDCLPALIPGCAKAQITDKIWGYTYDSAKHAEQEKAEAGAGAKGLSRTAVYRHFVNDECPTLTGSSCNTACPVSDDGVPAGADVLYTCGADGEWEAELKAYSKIKVFTHVSEEEVEEWAAYHGTQTEDRFFSNRWPKTLNLDVDLQDHDPIATLQSYLNYRGIACNVWAAKFVSNDATDTSKITQQRRNGDAGGDALFLDTGSAKLTTAGSSITGTDYVEIPPHLCTSAVREESGETGAAYTIPGKYNFKVRGGKNVLQIVYTNRLCHGGDWSPGNYATRYSGPGGWNPQDCQTKLLTDTRSHGGQGCSPDIFGISYSNGHCWCVPKSGRWRAATEDCDSFDYGTAHTWKFVQGMVNSPATLDCDNKYVDYTGEEMAVDAKNDFDPNVLVPAGTGLPAHFANRNSDPKYGAKNGWYFRVANEKGTAWDYVKQGMAGVEETEDEAEAEGWSNTLITKTTMGNLHGPFGQRGSGSGAIGQNTQVHKTFTMPAGATKCTVSFRFMRQWSWDHEYGYMHINGAKKWERRGASTCNNYDWKQSKDMPNVYGSNNHDCYFDAVVENIPCPAGKPFKVGFSSNLNEDINNENWAFTNFKIKVNGVPGDIAGLTVHHFDVTKEGTLAPNGKSDNFDWAYSAKRVAAVDCSNTTSGETYAHKTYASYNNLVQSCTGAADTSTCEGVAQAGLPSGLYQIAKEGGGTQEMYCETKVDGGGWTLMGSLHQSRTANGRAGSDDSWASADGSYSYNANGKGAAAWTNDFSFGTIEEATSGDYKNPEWQRVKGKNMMVWFVPNNAAINDWKEKSFYRFYTEDNFLDTKLDTLVGTLPGIWQGDRKLSTRGDGRRCNTRLDVPIKWDSSDTVRNEFYSCQMGGNINTRNVEKDRMTFGSGSDDGYSNFAICPGFRLNSCGDHEHSCMGGNLRSNWAGDKSNNDNSGHRSVGQCGSGWSTGGNIANSALFFFVR